MKSTNKILSIGSVIFNFPKDHQKAPYHSNGVSLNDHKMNIMGFNLYQRFQKKQGLPYVQVLSSIFSAAVFCPREPFIWPQPFPQCKIKTQNPFLCELRYLAHLAWKNQKDLEAALFIF